MYIAAARRYVAIDNMQAVKLVVVLIALFTTERVTVIAQNSVAPQVIAGTEPGTCPSQEDRDAARQQCPSPLRQYSANGVRACGRPTSVGTFSCLSLRFPSSGGHQYSRVCGQVIGYQIGSTDVFADQQNSIDTGYVDGVSITYGTSPRTHIWTYAAGLSEQLLTGNQVYSCPCLVAGSSYSPQTPPSFVGNNYYCESGNPTSAFEHTRVFRYTSDPLWDGQQCEGQCCSNGMTPPWFNVTLAGPTSDDIEVRICGTESTSNENTPIQIMELYVQ